MITSILKKVFGSRNDRLLRKYRHAVQAINALEPEMKALDDASLSARSAMFRVRIGKG